MKNARRTGQILGLVLVCFAVCAGGMMMMVEQSGWWKSEGEIVAIRLECSMRARKGDYDYKAAIPCEAVEAFKIVNADKTWRAIETYQSTVRFVGADGASTQTQMTLYEADGRAPQVGDTFPVLQNPQDLSEVVKPDAGMTMLLTVGGGMLGFAILAFAFRGKLTHRKRSGPVLDEESAERASAARADAMIAAALGRRDAESRGAPGAAVGAARSTLPYDGRAGFGRKR